MLPALLLVLAASPAAKAEPAAFALLPFGVDLYVQKKPVRAVLYTLTQGLGVAAAAYGTTRVNAYELNEDEQGAMPWKVVTGSGVSLTGASYLCSVVDASNLHTKDAADSAAWLKDWDQRRAALTGVVAVAPAPQAAR